MEDSKQLKSVLLAAQVTPDFVKRFDRAAKMLPGGETRSAALRFAAEQFVKSIETTEAGAQRIHAV